MARSLDYTLVYGGEVLSWGANCDDLLEEKAVLIYTNRVRYPELLEIFYKGKKWLFDRKFNVSSALLYMLWWRLGYPYAVECMPDYG